MPSAEYLDAHDLPLYLVEALKHVHRVSSGAGADASTNRHIEAAAEYFQAVATGRHVVGRDFAFVQATPRNRHAFLLAFERAFADSPAMPPSASGAKPSACSAPTSPPPRSKTPSTPPSAPQEPHSAPPTTPKAPHPASRSRRSSQPSPSPSNTQASSPPPAPSSSPTRVPTRVPSGADEGVDTLPTRMIDGGAREALAALARTREGSAVPGGGGRGRG